MSPEPQHVHLRPSQKEAVDRFFAPDAPRRQALLAPTGTGKSVVATAVVEESFRRGARSVLVLAAQNVVAQSIAWRSSGGVRVPFELHRALSASTTDRPAARWPDEVLAFGSLRRAAREPVAGAVRDRFWDLVIADLSGAAADDVENLHEFLAGGDIGRLLVLDNRVSSAQASSWLDAAPLAFDVPDTDSFSVPPLRFSAINFERSDAEVAIIDRAVRLAAELKGAGSRSRHRLNAAAASSPLALQSQAWAAAESLRQLQSRLAHGLPPQLELDLLADEMPAELPRVERLRHELMALADDVDQLEVDTKWDAFARAITAIHDPSVVIFCDFAETANYVADRLQFAGIEAHAAVEESAVPAVASLSAAVLVSTLR